MKYWTLGVLIIFAGKAFGQEGLGTDWNLTAVPGVEKAWTNPQKPGHMLTYLKSESGKAISFQGASKAQVFSGVLGFRQLVYDQLGFKHLKITHFKFEPGSNPILELGGKYVRPDGVPVHFFELQRYTGKTFEQFSYFFEGKNQAENQIKIQNLIRQLMGQTRSPSNVYQPEKTEAMFDDSCADCLLKSTLPTLKDLEKVAEATDQCAVDSWLFDPAKKSILQEFSPGSKAETRAQIVARSFLTCAYGTISGSFKSIRDIVMAIPNLLGFSWQALKSAGSSVLNAQYSQWFQNFSLQKVTDSAGDLLTATKDSVAGAYQTASLAVYNGFQEGGVTGSVASVAHAAWNSSPHKAVGQFLSKLGAEIYSALSKEWTALGCMSTEAMSEAICQVGGYIITDLITGKLALSALSKAPKMKDAIAAVRAKMERVPIAGALLTKNLRATNSADCGKFEQQSWKTDSGLKLQGQDLSVVQNGGQVLALGISPKSMKLECFEVVGDWATQISDRIKATEARAAKSLSKNDDYFSAGSSAFARSDEEFIQGINLRIEQKLSSRQSKAIASALQAHPEQLERYGNIARSISDMKERLKLPGLTSLETDALKKALTASEQTLKTLNETIPNIKNINKLNLESINLALKAATASHKPEQVLVINQALYELGKSVKRNSGDLHEGFDAWASSLRRDRKHLTDKDVSEARACLISSGTK